ncbi:MAG: hypothetical protein KAT46_01325 [Deltaproteobacteria bacterium]|nr:hypothetical protein [Deltaproteobacteria bacterium]
MNFSGGQFVKEKKIRSVVRIESGSERGFFLKRHYGGKAPTVTERLKSFFLNSGKEDARNEWEMTLLMASLGFPAPTVIAFGSSGEGKEEKSLTLTEEVIDTQRASDFIPTLTFDKNGMDGVHEKRRIIRRLGSFAKKFHGLGLNHQDFYLVHFFLNQKTEDIFLMDLQRVCKRESPVWRWVRKDLAQFVFSAMRTDNFSRTDILRFTQAYLDKKESGFNSGEKIKIKSILKKSMQISAHDAKLRERSKTEVL